jgi:hypothetical protein
MAEIVAALVMAGNSGQSVLNIGEITTCYKVHKESLKQDKRFFYAEFTESVAHFGEEYAQAERHHGQAYPHAEGCYWQPARHHPRDVEQARLQVRADIDLTMRAEIREQLRDEFSQKLNRFEALMVCQTMMLAQACQLTYQPMNAPTPVGPGWTWVTYVYTTMCALALMVLTLSMWLNFVLTRRINEFTAGVMQIEMHQNPAWRQMMGQDDVTDNKLVRQEFNKWFKRHCSWLGTVSMHSFTIGVCLLFAAVGILLQSRMGLPLAGYTPLAGLPYWVLLLCVFAVLLAMELRERALLKEKAGVYRHAGRSRAADGATSLRAQLAALQAFEARPLDGRAEPGDTSPVQLAQAVVAGASREEQAARQPAPAVVQVARTAALSEKALKTNALLQRAWAMFQRNELDEADRKLEDWERDDHGCDVLSEVQRIVRLREVSRQYSADDKGTFTCDDLGSAGDGGAASVTAAESDGGSEESSGRERKRAAEAVADPLRALAEVDPQQIDALNEHLGSFFRSTLVRVANASSARLLLKSKRLQHGRWAVGAQPPTEIEPWTEVVFASTSSSYWFGAAEAEVVYDTQGVRDLTLRTAMQVWERGCLIDFEHGVTGGGGRARAGRGRVHLGVPDGLVEPNVGGGARSVLRGAGGCRQARWLRRGRPPRRQGAAMVERLPAAGWWPRGGVTEV